MGRRALIIGIFTLILSEVTWAQIHSAWNMRFSRLSSGPFDLGNRDNANRELPTRSFVPTPMLLQPKACYVTGVLHKELYKKSAADPVAFSSRSMVAVGHQTRCSSVVG